MFQSCKAFLTVILIVCINMMTSWANESDRLALLAFKAQINDDPNGVLQSWDDLDHCQFHGVMCNSAHPDRRVTALTLPSQNLGGTLSPHIGNLSHLRQIWLKGNNLHGSIPEQVHRLSHLEFVSLHGNLFDGHIPLSLITSKGIKILDLSYNHFYGKIPTSLSTLNAIRILDLSHNDLEGPVLKDGAFKNASIFKVNGNDKLCGGVAELNLPPCNGKSPSLKLILPLISGILLILLAFVCFICYQRRTSKVKASSPSSFNQIIHDDFMRITYKELLSATNNFSDCNLIGTGSYGCVYKGILDQTNTKVAVKVFKLQQRGASKSFLSECNALRNIRHRNLLKIITSCSSVDFQGNDFKALVFEYMPNGSLEEWLHPKRVGQHEPEILNCLQRLNIAIDIASVIDYLHCHCQQKILHCDLKPSNILLDRDMIGHVSDFGLAKILSFTSYHSSQSHGSSIAIKGSIGYIPPEYGLGGEFSMKGDVYSYGILLLEIFTGKRPTDSTFQEGQNLHSFAKMASPEQVMKIVDPKMLFEGTGETIKIPNPNRRARLVECSVLAIRLGVSCSAESPSDRIDMGKVITELYHIRDRMKC